MEVIDLNDMHESDFSGMMFRHWITQIFCLSSINILYCSHFSFGN